MTDTLNYGNLLAGQFPQVPDEVTILSGENLVKGTVLGKITATGKCVAVDSGNADGSQNPYAVLAEAVDASAADTVGVAYLSGHFNETALTFGGADTITTHRVAMRALSMYASPNVPA